MLKQHYQANNMPLKFSKDPSIIVKHLVKLVDDMPRIAGIEAERFFKESFRRQGWQDNVFIPWTPRKGQRAARLGEKRQGRAVLIKSGALRKSVRVLRRGKNFVIVGTSLPYAQIHNDGGTIQGTFRVKAHLRANRKKPGKHPVESHTRQVNTRIPRRRFIGNSAALNAQIIKVFRQRIKAI